MFDMMLDTSLKFDSCPSPQQGMRLWSDHRFHINIQMFAITLCIQITQSKTLLPINEIGSKIARNSVFNCHVSPVGRQMAIENSVSNDFFYLPSSIVLTFSNAPCPLC